RILHLKFEIRNRRLDSEHSRSVQSQISDFEFKVQDSSNFKFLFAGVLDASSMLTPAPRRGMPITINRSHLIGRAKRAQVRLSAVDANFLAVGQYGPLHPHDLLTVGKLIADARDRIAGFDRVLRPAIRLHPIDGGPTDQPLLGPAIGGPNLYGNHR